MDELTPEQVKGLAEMQEAENAVAHLRSGGSTSWPVYFRAEIMNVLERTPPTAADNLPKVLRICQRYQDFLDFFIAERIRTREADVEVTVKRKKKA